MLIERCIHFMSEFTCCLYWITSCHCQPEDAFWHLVFKREKRRRRKIIYYISVAFSQMMPSAVYVWNQKKLYKSSYVLVLYGSFSVAIKRCILMFIFETRKEINNKLKPQVHVFNYWITTCQCQSKSTHFADVCPRTQRPPNTYTPSYH